MFFEALAVCTLYLQLFLVTDCVRLAPPLTPPSVWRFFSPNYRVAPVNEDKLSIHTNSIYL